MATVPHLERLSLEAELVCFEAEVQASLYMRHRVIDSSHVMYAVLMRPNIEPVPRILHRDLHLTAEAAYWVVTRGYTSLEEGRSSSLIYTRFAKRMLNFAAQCASVRGRDAKITLAELVAGAVTSNSPFVNRLLAGANKTPEAVIAALKVTTA